MSQPRKKPLQARARASYQAILRSAEGILETSGQAGFGTNQVAEAAGVSIGTLYQYFPNKDAIVAALIVQRNADFVANMSQKSDGVATTKLTEAVQMLMHASISHFASAPNVSRILDELEANLPEMDFLERSKRQVIAQFVGVLAEYHVPQPEIAARDLRAIALSLVHCAMQSGETDLNVIEARTIRATLGYLQGTSAL